MSAPGPAKFKALQGLAQLILDARLSELQALAREREQSQARLADLNRSFAPSDLHPVAAAEAELRFQRWADLRRAEVNAVIARQEVRLDELRGAARAAFGRAQALSRLGDQGGGSGR